MNNQLSKLSWIALAIAVVFSSCKPEKKETITTENYKGVFVVNEGGFMKSNGTIGLHKPGTQEYFDAFQKANGRPLGDVVQSMTLINGKYFIVVNNSNKIEVVNQSDFKSITTISVNQPRNIVQITDAKAYVTQLNSTEMAVVNLTNNTVEKTINVKCATDNIAVMGKYAYVGMAYADRLYLIDVNTDAVADSIIVGSGLGSIVNVGSSQIGVFCLGMVDFSNGNVLENGKIALIGPDSNKVVSSIILSTGSFGGTMAYNSGFLYYTFGDGKLYRSLSSVLTAAPNAFITISGSIYGVTADPSNGDLYLTDAKDFNSSGKVYIYSSSGDLQKEFTAGITPGKMVFNY